ncbi:MAG: Mur ligase domain-containing protein, partial [bacterium]|nr:Mur ligase domain-containing protein [bacterium]
MQTIHFIGIGGVGMSALAQAFLDKGWQVSGSDRLLAMGEETPVLRVLREQGCRLFPQDGSGIQAGMSVV